MPMIHEEPARSNEPTASEDGGAEDRRLRQAAYGEPNIHADRIEEFFSARASTRQHLEPSQEHLVYIICFTNRCGSNLLSQALTVSGALGRPHEYFNHEFVTRYSEEHDLRSLDEFVISLQETNSSVNGVFSTKLGAGQLLYLARVGVIPRLWRTPTFVHVRRRDIVAQAVSFSIASQTRAWTSHMEADPGPVRYDEADILGRLRQIVRSNALLDYFFALHDVEPLVLEYEDFRHDLVGAVTRVAAAVGVGGELDVPPEAITLEPQRDERNESFERRIRNRYRLA